MFKREPFVVAAAPNPAIRINEYPWRRYGESVMPLLSFLCVVFPWVFLGYATLWVVTLGDVGCRFGSVKMGGSMTSALLNPIVSFKASRRTEKLVP